MKKSILKTLLILAVILLATACEDNLIYFDGSKEVVGFSSPSLVIKENAGTGQAMVYLGSKLGATATVNFEVSTDGFDSPAVEGVDYTIGTSVELTTGVTGIPITVVDNAVFGGDLKFKITLLPGTGYELTTASTCTVTISDDEHPLKNWIGTYDVAAASYGSPGAWDESWVVVTAPVAGDVTKLTFTGIGDPSSDPITGVLDTDAMTITFSPGQNLGDPYGYGDTFVYFGYEDLTWDITLPLEGTIDNDGTILVDNWCHQIDDWAWDVFNTTWTKRPAK